MEVKHFCKGLFACSASKRGGKPTCKGACGAHPCSLSAAHHKDTYLQPCSTPGQHEAVAGTSGVPHSHQQTAHTCPQRESALPTLPADSLVRIQYLSRALLAHTKSAGGRNRIVVALLVVQGITPGYTRQAAEQDSWFSALHAWDLTSTNSEKPYDKDGDTRKKRMRTQ